MAVILNQRNITPHTGVIREVYWHRARRRFYYHLQEAGKPVSKRYFEDDLLSLS